MKAFRSMASASKYLRRPRDTKRDPLFSHHSAVGNDPCGQTSSPLLSQSSLFFTSQSHPRLQPSSPFDISGVPAKTPTKTRKRKTFIPRKAAVELTSKARAFFQRLLDDPPRPEIIGVMLNFDQSKTGQPRMVFTFSFVTAQDLVPDDEGVSLEVDEDGKPLPPTETWNDGRPKLYVNHNAFLKVLGAIVDVDTKTVSPILFDKEGNKMDPNA